MHTVYVGSYELFITAPFLFDLHFAYANTDSVDIHTSTKGEVKMNEFFQKFKKDHVEVNGILGQLVETKETKKREELFLNAARQIQHIRHI